MFSEIQSYRQEKTTSVPKKGFLHFLKAVLIEDFIHEKSKPSIQRKIRVGRRLSQHFVFNISKEPNEKTNIKKYKRMSKRKKDKLLGV